MSLMLKLLATTLLLSSVLGANQNAKVEKFLTESFSNNPAIIELNVKVLERIKIPNMKGWDALIIVADGTVKEKDKKRKIKQKMVWFSDGNFVTKELTNIDTGESLKESIRPTMSAKHYTKANLIYGNVNAKHKVVIFSDPLCPFCGMFVPKAINEMRKQPNKFAIYYYHLPLPSIHPAAIELSKAAIAAELKGHKDVVLKMYDVKINPKERDVAKILKAFNTTLKTNIKPADLKSPEVMKHYMHDQYVSDDLMVAGTPTVFFDNKVDNTKRKYQKVK